LDCGVTIELRLKGVTIGVTIGLWRYNWTAALQLTVALQMGLQALLFELQALHFGLQVLQFGLQSSQLVGVTGASQLGVHRQI
jgi:hypothetical protein